MCLSTLFTSTACSFSSNCISCAAHALGGSAPPLSLTHCFTHPDHMPSAPPVSLMHSQHFTRVSRDLPLPHDYKSYAQSSRQPSSPELLHLPHLARLDSNPAAGMGFRDARVIIPPPVDALV
jgi:hypothetical protein